MAGHSFFDDNTSRFYPFNEERIQERREELTDVIDILKRGIADVGIVVASGRTLVGNVYGKLYSITSNNFYYTASFNVSSVPLTFEWTAKEFREPFVTIKAETADGETFGYLVLGHSEVWQSLPLQFSWTKEEQDGVDLQRSRISWLDQRQVTQITAFNTERLRATAPDGCPPIEWQFGSVLNESELRSQPLDSITPGTITDRPIVFREGYNCSITTDVNLNRFAITPVAGAGLGIVAEDLPRGYGERKPITAGRTRYDGALEYSQCAYKLNEAVGPIINVYTSHHFKTESEGNVVTISLISAGVHTEICE
jgi:hypothetical protein